MARLPKVLCVVVVTMLWSCTTVRQPSPDITPELMTAREFRTFIDELGYSRQELWSERGWTWRTRSSIWQPDRWNDGRADSNPVTGISWYEADAFCRFRGRQLPPLEPREVGALAEPTGPAPEPIPRIRGPIRFLEAPGVPYLETVHAAIQRKWMYPCVRTSSRARCEYKATFLVVMFGIAKNGDFAGGDLISSSGYATMDEVAIKAITRAAPFPPVPDDLSDSGIPIWATFVYEVTGPAVAGSDMFIPRPRVAWEWVGVGADSGVVRQFRHGPERLHVMRNSPEKLSVLVPVEARTPVIGFRCVASEP